MTNTATAARTADEITDDIDALGRALQAPSLDDLNRAAILDQIQRLGDELRTAIEQEEVTAAEDAAYGRPEQYL